MFDTDVSVKNQAFVTELGKMGEIVHFCKL